MNISQTHIDWLTPKRRLDTHEVGDEKNLHVSYSKKVQNIGLVRQDTLGDTRHSLTARPMPPDASRWLCWEKSLRRFNRYDHAISLVEQIFHVQLSKTILEE